MIDAEVRAGDRFATKVRPTRRPWRIAVALLQAALAVQFIAAGTTKLLGDAQMVAMFEDIGAGQWFRLVVGVLEVAGGAGLLVPRVAGLAATGLVTLMTGAVLTNVMVLAIAPWMPLAFGVAAAAVAVTRCAEVFQTVHRWMPAGRSTQSLS